MNTQRFTQSALVATWLVCAGWPAHAQTATELFDASSLHDIQLFINTRDLSRLRAGYETNTYYTADLLWRGVRVRNVAVRSRGLGSRNPTKLGLRIDFNRYTGGQTFLGLNSLILDNLWQDASTMREKLAMAMFERMGQPASRESFGRLFINSDYEGLYAIVEAVDDAYLSRVFGENTGYAFEYKWLSAYRGEDLGDDLSAYRALFEPQTHEHEADATLFAPIRALVAEVSAPDDPVWRERVEQYLDVNQFVTYLAIETFVSENDGVLGYAGMNNFYLYRGTGGMRHRLVPWDKDNAFLDAQMPIFHRVDENIIARRILAFEDLRTRYLDVLEQCARLALGDDWLIREVDRVAALISDAARADPKKPFSNDALEEGIAFMREFAQRRPAFVLAEVAAARR
jgi:spore coat protein CotH